VREIRVNDKLVIVMEKKGKVISLAQVGYLYKKRTRKENPFYSLLSLPHTSITTTTSSPLSHFFLTSPPPSPLIMLNCSTKPTCNNIIKLLRSLTS
jgi:hypothetical protein